MAYVTADTIINKALSFVGVKENPKGSNDVPFVRDYFNGILPANSSETAPWCVVFGWDIFRMCGASEMFCDGAKVGSCSKVLKWAAGAGLTVSKDKIRRGDILLFDWNKDRTPDHFGFATGPASSGKVPTIEGNTDDQVAERSRPLTDVGYVIRPRYLQPDGSTYPSTEQLRKVYDYLKSTYDIIKE